MNPVDVTQPQRTPLFKGLPRLYANYRRLSIFCRGSEDGIRAALPDGLEYVDNHFEIFIMECPEVYDQSNPTMGPRHYLEGGVVVTAGFEGLKGGHVLYEYVTTDDAMAGGREIFGYPKKLANVTFDEGLDGTIRATVTRLGYCLIDAAFKPEDKVAFTKPALHPRLQIKQIPRVDGAGYDVDQIVRVDLKDFKFKSSVLGSAAVRLGGRAHMDPLFELGLEAVLGAEMLVGDFVLGPGSVHHDRLR